MYIGRITGKNLTELRFRCLYEEEIYVGEILIVEDEERDCKFFLRVVDIEYGAESGSYDWTDRTAGTMITMDLEKEEYRLHDKSKRLYKTGVCAPLGFVKNNEFRKAKTIPSHFSRVRRVKDEDFDALKKFFGDLSVGYLRSGEEIVRIEAGIFGKEIPYHIGIFATTGMGKSNLMKCLAGSAMVSGRYGFLIFDPHGEYYDGGEEEKKGLKHHPLASKRLEVYSARELSGNYNKIRLSAHEIEVEDVMHIYEFSQAQRDAFTSATRVFGSSWLVELLEKGVDELVIELEGTYESTLWVIKRRLKNLFKYELVTKDSSISITRSIIDALHNGKTVLVDTSNMGESEELLVSIVIARAVFEYNKAIYGEPERFRKVPPVLITMEEAQRVLGQVPKGGRYNIFAQIAREGRKFKTGLCAISQQPKLIDPEIISQFNTLFILGLADKRDRDILRDSSKQDVSQLGNEVQMLMPGEGLITSPYAPFAVPVKIHLYEEYLQSLMVEDEESKVTVDDGFF